MWRPRRCSSPATRRRSSPAPSCRFPAACGRRCSACYPSRRLVWNHTKHSAIAEGGTTNMPGLYYDQFHVGQVFKHPIRRTITEADNVWFSALTHNPSYLHLNEEYCRNETEFGQRLVNSCFTLALMVGISVGDTVLGTAVA